ncbi:MAG: hypothetical protein ACKOBG_02625 [Actinomycetota bacterium]
MSSTRRPRRNPGALRRRDRIALLFVVLAAVAAGVVAGATASPRPWQLESSSGPK